MGVSVDLHARTIEDKLTAEVTQFTHVDGSTDFVILRFIQQKDECNRTSQVTFFLNDIGEVIKLAAEILKAAADAASAPYQG